MRRLLNSFAFVILASCAGEVVDIDRTGHDILQKDMFVGEWYAQWTITDVPYTTGFTFTGYGGQLDRVKWAIERGQLIARRSYEFTEGTDAPNMRDGAEWEGAPLYAFPIRGHFDRMRGYNTTTGEQNNVISESSADCQWYECKEMRVNWAGDARLGGEFGQFYVQGFDENDPDALIVDKENGYIEVNVRAFMAPELDQELTEYYGFPVPKCWLYSNPYWDCRGQTIGMKLAFTRMPHEPDTTDADGNVVAGAVKETFTPLEYDDRKLQRFGYHRVTRFHYDENYGSREANRKHYARIWNLWETNFREDGSVLPPAERDPKPIVYYLNRQFPGLPDAVPGSVDLLSSAQSVADQWDAVLVKAAAQAKGLDEATLRDRIPACADGGCGDQGRMFVLCRNNPVAEDDPAVCGPAGTEIRIGDPRYSMLYWQASPQAGAPGGFGPMRTDPITGEIVSATSYIYGAGYERHAAYIVDLMRLLLEETDIESFANAEDLAAQLRASELRRAAPPTARLSIADIQNSHRHERIFEKGKELAEMHRSGELMAQSFDARIAPIKADASLKHGILNRELLVQAMGGTLTGEEPDELLEQYDMFSLARRVSERNEARLKRAGIEGIDFNLFTDDAVLFIAQRLIRREDLRTDGSHDWDKIRAYLVKRLFMATALHEVGHNMGLRHNFSASTDAMNYHDSYWDLKTDLGILDPEFALNNDAIRALVQQTDENGASVREYQYSSVMDYGATWYQDLQGLGKYDQAAISYAYANHVEVFDYENAEQLFPADPASIVEGHNLGYAYAFMPNNYHYMVYPRLLAGLPIDAPVQNGMINGTPVAEIAGLIRQRRWVPVDANDQVVGAPAKLRVPYRFCSDEYVGGSSYCHRFDSGADVYETVRDHIARAEGYRPLAAIRRGRAGWHPQFTGGYMDRAIRIYDFLSLQYKHFVNEEFIVRRGQDCIDPSTGRPIYRRNDDGSPNLNQPIAHFVATPCGLEQYYAALTAGEFFVKTIQKPDVGTYYFDTVRGMYRSDVDPNDPGIDSEDSITLDGVGDSATGHLTQWDPERVGYYSFIKPTYAGYWLDKWAAMSYLTDTSSNFIGVDASSDTRSFSINFLNLFGDNLHQIIAGMFLGDPALYGPAWNPNKDPEDATDPFFYNREHLLTNNPEFPETYKLIHPGDRFFMRYISLVMATSWAVQETNNRDMNQNFKIALKGSPDDFELADEVRLDPERYIELTDPISRRIYWAVKTEEFGYSPTQDGYVYVAVGHELLRRIRDTYYGEVDAGDGGTVLDYKPELIQRFSDELAAEDPSLEGALLENAAREMLDREVHGEFFWVNLLRSIVDAYEFY